MRKYAEEEEEEGEEEDGEDEEEKGGRGGVGSSVARAFRSLVSIRTLAIISSTALLTIPRRYTSGQNVSAGKYDVTEADRSGQYGSEDVDYRPPAEGWFHRNPTHVSSSRNYYYPPSSSFPSSSFPPPTPPPRAPPSSSFHPRTGSSPYLMSNSMQQTGYHYPAPDYYPRATWPPHYPMHRQQSPPVPSSIRHHSSPHLGFKSGDSARRQLPFYSEARLHESSHPYQHPSSYHGSYYSANMNNNGGEDTAAKALSSSREAVEPSILWPSNNGGESPSKDYIFHWPADSEERKAVEEYVLERKKNYPRFTMDEEVRKADIQNRKQALIEVLRKQRESGLISDEARQILTEFERQEAWKHKEDKSKKAVSAAAAAIYSSNKRIRNVDDYHQYLGKGRSERQRQTFHGRKNRLYVGKLGSAGCSNTDLRRFFEQWGPVEGCSIARYHDTGKCRGFGFVYMKDEETAAKVLTAKEHWIFLKQVATPRRHSRCEGAILLGFKGNILMCGGQEGYCKIIPVTSPLIKFNTTDRNDLFRCIEGKECKPELRYKHPRKGQGSSAGLQNSSSSSIIFGKQNGDVPATRSSKANAEIMNKGMEEEEEEEEEEEANKNIDNKNNNAISNYVTDRNYAADGHHMSLSSPLPPSAQRQKQHHLSMRERMRMERKLNKPSLRDHLRPPTLKELIHADEIQTERRTSVRSSGESSRQSLLKALRFIVRNNFFFDARTHSAALSPNRSSGNSTKNPIVHEGALSEGKSLLLDYDLRDPRGMIDAWSKEAEIRRYEAAAAEDDEAAMATGGGGRGGMVGISSLTTPQYRRKGLLPPPAKPHPSLFSKRSPSPVPAAAAVSTPTAAEKRLCDEQCGF
eukprot:jgi/Bigna1/87797/estExt_fgenesh1_pg.C_240132